MKHKYKKLIRGYEKRGQAYVIPTRINSLTFPFSEFPVETKYCETGEKQSM